MICVILCLFDVIVMFYYDTSHYYMPLYLFVIIHCVVFNIDTCCLCCFMSFCNVLLYSFMLCSCHFVVSFNILCYIYVVIYHIVLFCMELHRLMFLNVILCCIYVALYHFVIYCCNIL